MRSNKEAKKILKAFGKEAYKERIEYVDSFMPEKTSFMGLSVTDIHSGK